MADVEESNKLVEHYSTNSLKLKGKTINVSFSTEYQTLSNIDDGGKEKSPVPHSRRRRSLSPKRRSHGSRRDSPSPKRRSYDSRKRDERHHSSEKSRRESSSRSRSKKGSPSKDEKSKTNKEDVEKMAEEDKDQSDNTGDDSDLEGVAVIADDGEELNSEDEFTVDEDMDYEILDTSDVLIEQDTSEDVQVENESRDQIIPSDMDASNVEAETSEYVPTVTNGSSEEENKKAQEIQGEQKELQQEEKEIQDEEKELQQGEQKELQQEDKEIQDEKKDLQKGEQKELQQVEQKGLQQGEQKELQQVEQKGLQQGEQKELQQGEQKEPKQEEKKIVEEEKDLQQGEKKEDKKGEQELKQEEKIDLTEKQDKLQGESEDKPVAMEEEAADFPENLEHVLTEKFEEDVNTEKGDEKEDSASKTEEVFGRVLEVIGFPVAKKYSEADLLKIGQKYGDVADCCLVRANRKVEKALIEMVNADDAVKVEAESKKQHIRLGGKILRISVSQKYSQVDEGKSVGSDTMQQQKENIKEPSCSVVSGEESAEVVSNAEMDNDMDTIMQTSGVDEEAYGRVLRIRNLPLPDQYTDADFLSIAEPYGTVKRHWMLRLHQTGLIEMENASDAEKVVAAAQMNKITIAGKHPKIIVSTKHAHLNKRYFLYGSSDEQTSIESEMAKDESNTQSSVSEQPSIQTSENVEESSNDNPDGSSVGDEKQVSVANDGTEMEAENSDPVPEIETPKLDPAGTEFVRPVVGYFCNLCNVIYASEEEAKNEHCSTPSHHQKLKEHKEQNGSA